VSRIGPSNSGVQQARLQSTLERLRTKQVDDRARSVGAPADSFSTTNARFGGPAVLPSENADRPAGARGALGTRLSALTGKAPERAITGQFVVEQASDLARFAGVTRLDGSLSLSECLLGAGDLSALKSLVVVTGGLSIEGARTLTALDGLSSLKSVGGALYVGFDAGLTDLSLPALEHVGRALVVEGNAALTRLALPQLAAVDGYLHVSDCPLLVSVSLPLLTRTGREIAFEGCPSLAHVEAPLLPGGAVVGD